MEIKEYTTFNLPEVLNLYKSVGWIAYTEKVDMLKIAFENSLLVLGSFEDNKLIGIIRVVGDGASILYIQDILVHPAYQRRGIGKSLLLEVLGRYSSVYQTVLITDDTPKTISFYQSCGFTLDTNMGCCAFIRAKY